MAIGNFLLATVDIAVVGVDGIGAYRKSKAAQRLSEQQAAEALARTQALAKSPAKTDLANRLSKKNRKNLEKWANAKNPKQRQKLYNQLREKLGDDFDEAIKFAETDLTSETTIVFRDESLSSSQKLDYVRARLTPQEQAIFDKELAATTPDEYATQLGKKDDPISSFKGKVKQEAAQSGGKIQQQRVDNAWKQLEQSGFVGKKEVENIATSKKLRYLDKVRVLREKIAVEQAAQKATTQYPASQGYEVFKEVDVAEAVGNYKSKAEWRAAHRGQDPEGLYESGGRLWKQKTDIDVMVVQKTPDGKYKTIEIQEVKSGKNDSPSDARGQSDNGRNGLQAINNGSNNIQLHQKKKDAEGVDNITDRFDRSQIAVAQNKALIVGPAQKQQAGFNRVGDSTTNDYNNLAKKILSQYGVKE